MVFFKERWNTKISLHDVIDSGFRILKYYYGIDGNQYINGSIWKKDSREKLTNDRIYHWFTEAGQNLTILMTFMLCVDLVKLSTGITVLIMKFKRTHLKQFYLFATVHNCQFILQILQQLLSLSYCFTMSPEGDRFALLKGILIMNMLPATLEIFFLNRYLSILEIEKLEYNIQLKNRTISYEMYSIIGIKAGEEAVIRVSDPNIFGQLVGFQTSKIVETSYKPSSSSMSFSRK